MDDRERAELERLLQNSQAGIEKKTIIERLSGKIADGSEDFIQIDKETQLESDGTIREISVFKIGIYACGCKSNGRSNFGGVDYKGNIVCAKHFYRCVRCHRPLSVLTVKSIKGYCYCARCARIVKLLRFLGLKK
jgi:hypothetical protein